MKIGLIAFTGKGATLMSKVTALLSEEGHLCRSYAMGGAVVSPGDQADENSGQSSYQSPSSIYIPETVTTSLSLWTENQFSFQEALIFIGATGICVRAIAPYLKSKAEDPAVVVMDEDGRYAISLLSGHLGGANDLTLALSDLTGAQPVITTATDVNKRFAVDNWAKEQSLKIANLKGIKGVSSALLKGETVNIYSEFPINLDRVALQPQSVQALPEGLFLMNPDFNFSTHREDGIAWAIDESKKQNRACIIISIKDFPEKIRAGETFEAERILWLVPPCIYAGIGCRKGVSSETIQSFLEEVLREYGFNKAALAGLASIDLKAEEPGLLTLAKTLNLNFTTYSPGELKAVEGSPAQSDFVESITGVGNVCERAALLAGEGGSLLIKKQAKNGITVALALKPASLQLS